MNEEDFINLRVPLLFMGFMSIYIIADDDTLDLNTDELENKQNNFLHLQISME